MPGLKLKQLQYESETLKRRVEFMMDGNVYLKNRLAEVLKDNIDKRFLEVLDEFQSRFIKEDDLIRLVRNDVAELDNLLVKDLSHEGILIYEIKRKIEKTSRNIATAENGFSQLQFEFNYFLIENLVG